MIKIELDPYEKKDLLEYLEYAKSHYYFEKPDKKWDNRYYNIHRIDHLIDCINGKVNHGGVYASSFETIQRNLTKTEKSRVVYREKSTKNAEKRRQKALEELNQKKKEEKDLIKEFESIWKD